MRKIITAALAALAVGAAAAGCAAPLPTASPSATHAARPVVTQSAAPSPSATPVVPVAGDLVPVEDVEALREQGIHVYVSHTGAALVVDTAVKELPVQVVADLDTLVGVTSADQAQFYADREHVAQVEKAVIDAGLGYIAIFEGMSFANGTWSPMGYVAAGLGTAKGLCRDTGGPVSRADADTLAAECAAATGFQVVDYTQ